MPTGTQRDEVRAARTVKFNRIRALGADLSEERRRYGSNQRALSHAGTKLINEGAPRQDREALTIDAPPAGVMDGVNTTFDLSAGVAGHQLAVIWGDIAGSRTIVLMRSTDNPPPGDAYFFDFNNPDQIIVGTPPQAVDTLIVTYKARGEQ